MQKAVVCVSVREFSRVAAPAPRKPSNFHILHALVRVGASRLARRCVAPERLDRAARTPGSCANSRFAASFRAVRATVVINKPLLSGTMLRDAFGRLRPIRWAMINIGGYLTVLQLRILNRLNISGVENLKALPSRGVLLVSNHLTHYMDSIVVFHSVSYLRRPYLLWPRTNLYIVAALETMKKSGWLPRLMAYNGTITIKRTWKEHNELIERKVDPKDIENVGTGLEGGWVVTYPQGTTTPGAPGRIGCAHIIKQFRPIVLPVRLEGLREAFDKTGLKLRKTGVRMRVHYGRPLDIDYTKPARDILEQVMRGIGEMPGDAGTGPRILRDGAHGETETTAVG